MRRRLTMLGVFLAMGLLTTLAVATGLAVWVDAGEGAATTAQAYVDDEQWLVTRYDRAGALRIDSVRTRGLNWSPQQAAGPPDTPAMGDQVTAWASQTSEGGPEWLTLEYAKAVIPRRVDVYENCGPGALVKVTVFDAAGKEVEAWSGKDPTPAAATSTVMATPIPVSLNVLTKKVKIYLASDKIPGWNEIDAVGLVSDKNAVQWARKVEASSTYASGGTTAAGAGGSPHLLAPSWCGLGQRGPAMEAGDATKENRQVEARGWPMLALWSEADLLAPTRVPQGTLPAGSTITANFAVSARRPQTMPLRPVWVGLAGDTLFFAIAWGVLWAALVIPRRFVGEVARFRRGACIRCGYDLGYDFVRGCPECGWRREGNASPSDANAHEPPDRR